MRRDFALEPFIPHPFLKNQHLQTLAGNFYRSQAGIAFRRERLDTPDGDFLDLDFAHIGGQALPAQSPLAVLMHGMEGDARRGYACATYRALAEQGIASVGINWRSCSGEMNRAPRLYHMGATDDLGLVVDWLSERFPNRPLILIGYSLGANVLLKYLGEQGSALQGSVLAAIAVSPPFELGIHTRLGHYPNKLYVRHFLGSLKTKVRKKARQLWENGGDIYRALMSTDFLGFDEAITAPLHGFRDAADYYRQCSVKYTLHRISVPTLLIRATDDPLFNLDVPFETIAANPYLYSGITTHGGHVGFVEGWRPGQHGEWSQRQMVRFLRLWTGEANPSPLHTSEGGSTWRKPAPRQQLS